MSFTKDKKTFQAAVCELMTACGRDNCTEGWLVLDTDQIVTRAGLEKCYELGIDVEEGETLDKYIGAKTADIFYCRGVSLGEALNMLAHWDDDIVPDNDDSI